MKVYFKAVGWFIIIGWLIGLIMFSIYMGSNFTKVDSSTQGLLVISLIVMIIIGPALGLLFFSHTQLIDKYEGLKEEFEDYKAKIEKEKDKMIERQAIMQYDLEEIKMKYKN